MRPRPWYVSVFILIYKFFYALKWYLCWRRRALCTHWVVVGPYRLRIDPGVFDPVIYLTSPSWLPIIDAVGVRERQRWAELGTGCGLAAIHAATRGATVVATDLSEVSIGCARDNAARSGVSVDFRKGDLFAPLGGERFDVVLFHPPYFPGARDAEGGPAWRYDDLPERFAAGLGQHLLPGGCAVLLLSSNGDCAAFLRALEAAGYSATIVYERELIVERVVGYRIEAAHGAV